MLRRNTVLVVQAICVFIFLDVSSLLNLDRPYWAVFF